MRQLSKYFFYSVACFLSVTALAKIISLPSNTYYFAESDRLVTFVNNRMLIAGAAILELIVAVLLFRRSTAIKTKAWGVLWLGSLFALYRVSLWLLGIKGPCHCLGGAVDWLPLSKGAIELSLITSLAYMIAGSLIILFVTRSAPRGNPSPAEPAS